MAGFPSATHPENSLFVVAENNETEDAHEPYFVLKFSLQRSQNFDSHTFDAAITHFDRLCQRDTCHDVNLENRK